MILTNCAACAAPLAHDAPRCVRCKTRYCNSTCQHDHWRRGYKQICKKIHRGGNAEQYHADNKYKEAVAVAVEKCADDTKGQTCYICTEALHWKTKEGLVRGCACRGTAGFAHVSCLAEQAEILMDEAEQNNLGAKVLNARFERWHTCSLCEQDYYSAVRCALGWACWKTYVDRPEFDRIRGVAMGSLGIGLTFAYQHADALSVKEADISTMRRIGAPEQSILVAQSNLATSYEMVGQEEQAVHMQGEVYAGTLQLFGEEHEDTLIDANNYASLLVTVKRFEEAKSLLRKKIPVVRRVLGESEFTLTMKKIYARALYEDTDATLDDLREAVATLEETERIVRRMLGDLHPTVAEFEVSLHNSRAALRARETPLPASSISNEIN